MSIPVAAARYEDALKKINQRRLQWAQAKKLLQETLTQISKNYSIGWRIGTNEFYNALQSVYLQIDDAPSGISSTDTDKPVKYTKYGGAIVFSQNYSGYVVVIYQYPFIDFLQSQKQEQVVATIDPNDVTAEFIIKNVGYFLEEITKWEESQSTTNHLKIFKLP